MNSASKDTNAVKPLAWQGLVIVAHVSSGLLPAQSGATWLSRCMQENRMCTTGGGDFDVRDEDACDAALVDEALREGPATPYSDLRRELGLE